MRDLPTIYWIICAITIIAAAVFVWRAWREDKRDQAEIDAIMARLERENGITRNNSK
jgi:predicted negative regulator of RcsB-dependent stress response